MLIIFEGSDLVGKSTAARRLKDYLEVKFPNSHVTLLHRGPPKQHPLDEYVRPLHWYRPGFSEHVICDRWHLGEIVYPAILERKSDMTFGVLRYVEAFLSSRGAVLVHLDADQETLSRRFTERGDPHRSLVQVWQAADMFRDVVGMTTLPVVKEARPDMISDAGRRAEGHVLGPVQMLQTYVGHYDPDVLYVGDTRIQRLRETQAFMPYRGTSGELLMHCLPMHPSWGAVNVNDVDTGHHLEYVLMRAKQVVALGGKAQTTLAKMGIRHTGVPHPQYVRRFHHRDTERYHDMLAARDGEWHRWS